MLYGHTGNDTLYGGEGNDYLYGETGNDCLYGQNGDDHLYGSQGNDFLSGGPGNDNLQGGTGSDQYLFSAGDGIDILTDFSSTIQDKDSILFNETIDKTKFALFKDQNDLVIAYSGHDQVTIKNQFQDFYGIENINFADESYLTADDINVLIQTMTNYADAHGLDLTGIEQVQASPELMNIVMNGWN
jgi:serralysin